MKPTILIAGATGATGSAATKFLLEKGFPVRALVHTDGEPAQKLKAQGAEMVVGDYLDFRSMQRAFNGVQRAYFVYTIRPGIVQATTHFAQAALDAKAEFIVNLSQRTARKEAKSESALQHWLAERVFDWAGTPVAHLRPTTFNEWLLYMRKGIRNGTYAVPFGPTGRFAPISALDQGAVIASLLADPSGHKGQTYELFGPVELTPPQIAEIISQSLGKEVRYEQISSEQWIKDITDGATIPFLAQHLDGIVFDHQEGDMAGTNENVQKIAGRQPETVAAFLERNRAAFQ
jgi:NAD(P)H dehydrogenase (quinone)